MTAELVTRLINARDALKSVSPSNEARRAARDAMADAANALSKADQIIAMQSQGREPVGFYCPTYLSRRKEYERNGMVIYDRPLGTSTSPLYAQPDRREVEVLREALKALRAVMMLRDRGFTKAVAKELGLEVQAAMSNTWIEIPYARARQALSQADAIAREQG